MKIFGWIFGVLLSVSVLITGMQYAASERVEVVELHTIDENGEQMTTRLWIVDDDGMQYLRVGADGSAWFNRLMSNKIFQVTRNDRTATYTAELRPEKRIRINQLMQDKYTWGDTFIGHLMGSRKGSTPIALHHSP